MQLLNKISWPDLFQPLSLSVITPVKDAVLFTYVYPSNTDLFDGCLSHKQNIKCQTNDFCFRSRHHFIFSSIWDLIWTKHVRWDQTKQTHLAFAKVLLSCYRTKAYLTRCVLNFLRGKGWPFQISQYYLSQCLTIRLVCRLIIFGVPWKLCQCLFI